jgi:putative FmdB family regulatory protein
MPTYDYECSDCGHAFEAFHSMSAEPISVCPECNGKLRRLIGAGAGILFKGSGFYQTDYRSAEYKKAASSDKSPEKSVKKDEKPASKKDKKTASKRDTKKAQ